MYVVCMLHVLTYAQYMSSQCMHALRFDLVSKVNLNDPCSESNQCLERHAVCDSGRCVCPRNLVRQNNACGKFWQAVYNDEVEIGFRGIFRRENEVFPLSTSSYPMRQIRIRIALEFIRSALAYWSVV